MRRVRGPASRLVTVAVAIAVAGAGLVAAQVPAAAEPLVDRLTFTPVEDTYVDAANPSVNYGSAQTVRGGSSPVRRSLLKFDIAGLQGRTPQAVRLRLHAATTADSGGRVLSAPAAGWSESTATWADQPVLGGVVGSLPAPTAGGDYEAVLSVGPNADGRFALALDSTSSSEARWDSREALDPPVLVVDVPHIAGQSGDGVTAVSTPMNGSEYPTYLSSNDHLAKTPNGRVLAVHGRHRTGVVLAWRDVGGGWQNVSRGAATNGVVLGGQGTGGWPSSVVVGRDPSGAQVAYVVMGGNSESSSLHVRRISDLDSPLGPHLGPLATLISPGPSTAGARRVDAAVESAPGGDRVVVSWTEEQPAGTFRVRTGWITDLAAGAPVFSAVEDWAAGSGTTFATVVEAPAGLALVTRQPNGRLAVARHDAAAPPGGWGPLVEGASVPSISYPSAVTLSDGTVVASLLTTASTSTVAVQRFPVGEPARAVEGQVAARRQPVVASDGQRVWLVSVRESDGAVVSRSSSRDGEWDASDAVELAQAGIVHAWPSAMRMVDGRLRVLAQGQAGTAWQTQVVFAQRPAATTPGQPPRSPAAVHVVGTSATQSGLSQSTTTSVTLSLPGDAQPGDLLFAHIGLQSKLMSPGLAAPAGWSLVEHPGDSSGEAYLYRAVLGRTVTGTSWTWSGGAVSNKWAATLSALRYAGETVVSASSFERAATTVHSSPSVAAPAGGLLVAFAGDRRTGGSSWSWPSDWQERSDITSTGKNGVSASVATSTVDATAVRWVAATRTGSQNWRSWRRRCAAPSSWLRICSPRAWVTLVAVSPAA